MAVNIWPIAEPFSKYIPDALEPHPPPICSDPELNTPTTPLPSPFIYQSLQSGGRFRADGGKLSPNPVFSMDGYCLTRGDTALYVRMPQYFGVGRAMVVDDGRYGE